MEFHEFIKEIEGPRYKITGSQNELLTFIHSNKSCIVYKNRQEGISTAMSLYLLWLLIIKPNINIALLCEHRQEREIFRQSINMSLSKLEDIFRKKLGEDVDVQIKPLSHTLDKTIFPNGSKIKYYVIPSSNINVGRGERFDIVYFSDLISLDTLRMFVPIIAPCLDIQDSRMIITTTCRDVKNIIFNNNDFVSEYWSSDLFDGKRAVLVEKC